MLRKLIVVAVAARGVVEAFVEVTRLFIHCKIRFGIIAFAVRFIFTLQTETVILYYCNTNSISLVGIGYFMYLKLRFILSFRNKIDIIIQYTTTPRSGFLQTPMRMTLNMTLNARFNLKCDFWMARF